MRTMRLHDATFVIMCEREPGEPYARRQLEAIFRGGTLTLRDTQDNLILREVSVPVELLFTIYPLMAGAIREGQKERGGSWRNLWTRLWTS